MIARIFTIYILLYCIFVVVGNDILSADGDGKSITLICKSDSITGMVSFKNNNGDSVGACLYPQMCSSAFGYHLFQDTAKNETYLDIPFCNKSVEGTWECFHTSQATYYVSCAVSQNDVAITEPEQNKVTCTRNCTDHDHSLRFELLDSKSMTSLYNVTTNVAGNSDGCANKLEKSYSASFLASSKHAPGKTVKIRCHAIAKGVTEPKTIPNATTSGHITLNTENSPLDDLIFYRAVIAVLVLAIVVLAAVIVHYKRQIKKEGQTEQQHKPL